MPPRRSTRSARSSIEPEHQEVLKPTATIASKRKRSQQPEEVPIAEKENIAKPARRASSVKASAAPATKGRTSARPRVSLQEVIESDEDEDGEEAPRPPVKKARPSPEVQVSEDEVSEEEDLKPKVRKSVVPKKGRGRKAVAEDSEEEWDEPPKASTKTKKSTSASKSNGKKSSAKPKTTSDGDVTMDAPKSDIDSEIEASPIKKKAAIHRPAISSSDETTKKAAPQEEEIEESLLDPIPPSTTQSQSQSQMPAPPAEPTGPKSRLTIHKMALINFKSYAGRQEIGPFHKVRISWHKSLSQ